MQITALVKSPDNVCARYRVNAFRSAFEKAGHRLEVRGLPKHWVSRFLFYRHLRHTDALLVQRRLFPSWQLKLIRQRVRWLIFDFDDAVFLRNSYHPRGPNSARRARRFDEMVQAADAVVAGNEFLRARAALVAGAARAHLIPTCVDVSRYHLASHDPSQTRVRLVWVGSASTLEGVGQCQPVLETLGKSFPALQLKIICDRSLTLDHLPVHFTPWQEQTEAMEIAQGEIGISWLPDDQWSEGKCGLKILQYMAAGLPVVANPVGPHKTLIRHGETGFLAESPAQWQEAIGRLANDPTLRRTMGRAGRRHMEASYSVTPGATSWLRVLSALCPGTMPRAS